jgi:hypothetical protein
MPRCFSSAEDGGGHSAKHPISATPLTMTSQHLALSTGQTWSPHLLGYDWGRALAVMLRARVTMALLKSMMKSCVIAVS